MDAGSCEESSKGTKTHNASYYLLLLRFTRLIFLLLVITVSIMATFRICRTVVFFLATACTLGFAPEPRLSSFRKDQQLTVMELAKKMRNKQAELAKKMALAKKQKDGVPGEAKGVTKGEKLSAKEMKEKNDRLRFEELLQKQTTSLNSVSSDGYLNKQQEDEEIRAYSK